MTLSQMQEIGGCQAIVISVSVVQTLVMSYLESDIKYKLHTNDNYLIRHEIDRLQGHTSHLSILFGQDTFIQFAEDRNAVQISSSARLGNCSRNCRNLYEASPEIKSGRR
jgi:hypothetical protein